MNRHEQPRLLVEALNPRHDRTQFSSGVEPLDRYLRIQATQDLKRNVAAPFVAVEEGSQIIKGYYTLSMTSIDLETLPTDIAKRLPKYPHVPAVLLGRLAVDQRSAGLGLGKFLLMDALGRSLKSEIAWVATVVEAKDEKACSFYEKYGFIRFLDAKRKLFLPRRKIEVAFQ